MKMRFLYNKKVGLVLFLFTLFLMNVIVSQMEIFSQTCNEQLMALLVKETVTHFAEDIRLNLLGPNQLGSHLAEENCNIG